MHRPNPENYQSQKSYSGKLEHSQGPQSRLIKAIFLFPNNPTAASNMLSLNTRSNALNIILVIALVCVSSCVQLPTQKNETINELIIRNNTNSELLDVALRVPDKNLLISVNLILPHREYSLGFRELENQRDQAVITWIHRRRSYTRRIDAPIPETLDRQLTYRAVIIIHDNAIDNIIVIITACQSSRG